MNEKIVIQQRPPKSPAAAAILSILFPGIGTLYNGLITKGVLYMIIFIGLIITVVRASMAGSAPAIVFSSLVLAAFYFFQIIDSINSAKAINARAAGGETGEGEAVRTEILPETKPAGSIFWGAVLIILGVLLILANFDIILYETLFDFWPVAIIVIGLKFIMDYFAKAKNGNNGG